MTFSSPLPSSPRDPAAPVEPPLQQGKQGEFIPAKAIHWKREAYIPLEPEELGIALAHRQEVDAARLRRATAKLVRYISKLDRIRRRRLGRLYSPLDPDREATRVEPDQEDQTHMQRTMHAIGELLQRAAFTRLNESDVAAALGVASNWGVRVHVDFKQLRNWAVFARGDICGIRPHRHWRRLWRSCPTQVALYQRLVVMFQVEPTAKTLGETLSCRRLHLRIFKNIPKDDVDMLLPSSRPQLTWVDRSKILVPTLGSVGMTVFKIARGLIFLAFVGMMGTLALCALIVAMVGNGVRSFFAYLQARDRLQLNLTRSLYFQKLDSGAGVIWNLCQAAAEQEVCEGILASAVLMKAEQPLSADEIKQRAEALVQRTAELEIDFRAEPTLDLMHRAGLIERTNDDRWIWQG